MTYLMDFGESGKNFIEIGKRRNVQETMIRLAMPLEADGIPRLRRNNAEAQTWKEQLGSFGPRFRLHGNELWLWSGWRQTGDDLTHSLGARTRRHILRY